MSAIIRWATPVVLTMLFVAAVRAEDKPGYIGVMIKADPGGKGILIVDLASDDPAHKGGVRAEDVVTKIDGKDVGSVADFVKTIKEHKPGDKITLQVLRDGKEMEFKITVGKAPANTNVPPSKK